MLTQAAALVLFATATGLAPWALAAVLLGAGTALVYPTLLAAIGDVAHPAWRASAVGVYRLWRDTGYAIGALIAGITADLIGLRGAVTRVRWDGRRRAAREAIGNAGAGGGRRPHRRQRTGHRPAPHRNPPAYARMSP